MKKTTFSLLLSLCTIFIFDSCDKSAPKAEELSDSLKEEKRYDLALASKLDLFKSISLEHDKHHNIHVMDKNPELIKLGHTLYFETGLSLQGNNSCNSCHNLSTFGVDNLPTSLGDKGQNGDRNSPTVLNAALHTSQFWDGRAKDVEEQAGMPVLNPIEMGIPNEKYLIDKLAKSDLYNTLFQKAFPNAGTPLTYKNLCAALGAFERELLTPSRFDKYLEGHHEALSLQEKKGLLTFINVGCTNCHSGVALGGNTFQKFGVHKNYWQVTGSKKIDVGRITVTNEATDKHVFKVPSLRNIDKTHPYFHDGSVSDLKKAVEIMADIQLNTKLSVEELDNVTAFLKSLTGEVPAKYQKAPTF